MHTTRWFHITLMMLIALTATISTPPALAAAPVAADTFGRSLSGSWGSADTGGAWSACGSVCSVSGGVGRLSVAKGTGVGSYLTQVSTTDADVQADVSLDRAATGSGTYVSVVARGSAGEGYRAKLQVTSSGATSLALVRLNGWAEASLASTPLPAGTFTVGAPIRVRVQAVGTSPTQLKAKAWRVGAAEPSWQLQATDNNAASQKPSGVGVFGYVSSSATNGPTVIAMDNMTAVPTIDASNVDPTAAFNATTSNLTVNLDATASSDTDGTITTYAWTYGDTTSGTGATTTHTYTTPGTYPITLTVTDNKGATASTTKNITVTASNVDPTAAFNATTSNLTVNLDATASSDTDGTITTYAWTYGDTTSGTGATTTHTYTTPGTYPITLTVTDNKGATDTTTKNITVTAAPKSVAADTFGRSLSGSWGSADTGGAWSACGSVCSVSGGVGRLSVAKGTGVGSYLTQVSTTDADVQADVSLDRAATGSGTYVSVVARGSAGEGYRAKLQVTSSGATSLALVRLNGWAEASLASTPLPAGTFTVGAPIRVRVQAVGTSPTQLKAKAWRVGAAEPSWQLQATDNNAASQKPSGVGVFGYVSSSATNGPTVIAMDNMTAVPTIDASNVDPTAAFNATTSNLTVNLDATASSDTDGTITTYAWTYGDTTSGTGATTTHTYTTPGTYPITLTVTDNKGATASTTKNITVGDASPTVRVNVAGDLGYCGSGGNAAGVAALLRSNPAPLIAPGDMAYPDGSPTDFSNCYAPHFGEFQDSTFPVPGNHDYNTAGAAGYFGYFGSRVGTTDQPYYSKQFGAWRFMMLNSNCSSIGGCGPDSPQYKWLASELDSETGKCIAAVWHHPRYSLAAVQPMWDLLHSRGADVVFVGHAHQYERFARMNSAGQIDPTGIREFVVGTGGAATYPLGTPLPGSESRAAVFGALQVDLSESSYSWRFLPAAGSSHADTGSDSC